MPISLSEAFSADEADITYLREMFASLTDTQQRRLVSEWAEESRYLPSELTNKPGRWDNSYAPYLTEPMDCLSPDNPARKVVVMKGAQIGATTGLLENFVGYTIEHDPAGMLYISADADLTKMAMELKIDRMLHHSNLKHLLSAPDGKSKRSGDTAMLKEFPGGFLAAFGGRNPNKLRFISAKKALIDELDGMPQVLGGIGAEEGGVLGLIEKRTDAYESTRKILYLSTPLKMQTSLIYPLYMRGDQRNFHVPCVHCGFMQKIEWHGVTDEGKTYGITFELDDVGKPVDESIGYVCRECFAVFHNHDKSYFLSKGEYVPESETEEDGLVSFHIPSFLSPPGMYSWKGSVQKWLLAWDTVNGRVRDIDKLQQFYNLERGLPWEERGESPKFERVQQHRRHNYSEGQIPNEMAIEETGAPISLLTTAADVHGDRIDVEVVGWCQDRQSYSIEWLHFDGDPEDPGPDGPWGAMWDLVKDRVWIADDGRAYRSVLTLIDSGFKSDAVNQFCMQFSGGVFPVMGRELSIRGASFKEFQQSTTQLGNTFFNVTTSLYKDRLAAWLRSDWGEGALQPTGYPNYPVERSDTFFRQYEAEEKVLEIDPRTKVKKGMRWRQKGQLANHAWDARVYGMCALDMIAYEVCIDELELEKLSYVEFFKYATPRKNSRGDWIVSPFSSHPGEVAA